MELRKNFWMVVWSKKNGVFKNTKLEATPEKDIEEVSTEFEAYNNEYRVIHIGEGELPPKTYRSLEYLS